MPINVVIVDDHGVMREGLQAMLSGAADVRVVACEGGAAEGIEAVLRTRPQVVLMDITMPGMSGIEATQKLQRAAPLAALTPRERQVLELIVDGRTNAQAAAVLHLSPRSVETYRGRLMQKLGIGDLPSLVKFAIRNGITAAG